MTKMKEKDLGVKRISGKSRRVTLTEVFPSDWEWAKVSKILQTENDGIVLRFRKA